MSYTNQQSGFILVLTLMLLALAAVLLTGLVLSSTSRAFEVVVAQEHLQRKWGVISIEEVALLQADQLLTAQADDVETALSIAPAPLWISRLYTQELGGLRFTWRIQDEQAKLNLNVIYQERGLETVERLVREQLALSGGQGVSVNLHPDRHAIAGPRVVSPASASEETQDLEDEPQDEKPPAFGSWAEVFESLNPAQLGGFRDDDRSRPLALPMTARITCWGDGRINLKRTTSDVLVARVGDLLDTRQADELIQWAASQDSDELARWLEGPGQTNASSPTTLDNPSQDDTVVLAPEALNAQANQAPIDAATRQRIAPLLTTKSTCFSMALQIVTSQRTEYQWLIHLSTEENIEGEPAEESANHRFAPFPGTLRFIGP